MYITYTYIVNTHTHTSVRKYINVYVCVCIYIYTCTCLSTHADTQVQHCRYPLCSNHVVSCNHVSLYIRYLCCFESFYMMHHHNHQHSKQKSSCHVHVRSYMIIIIITIINILALTRSSIHIRNPLMIYPNDITVDIPPALGYSY